jgi:hypothetical protein
MAKSKIFIASSGRMLTLAEQLREAVKAEHCEAVLWKDVSSGKESDTIIEMLEGASREYDFAVIVLAKDELMTTATGETMKARDNCVFEAGLFMASIGRKRCFIVTSVPKQDLPSDFGGIIYQEFKEPDDINDPDQCKSAILSASTAIKSNAFRAGPIKRPLSPELLLARERHKEKHPGGELYEGQVVVASAQPLALGFEAARQVMENIDSNIRYTYIFPGTPDLAEKIPQLLQLVLLASLGCSPAEAGNFGSARAKVQANRERILDGLRQICANESITIFFVPAPHDVQYCIHNATDDKNAKLYVRHKDGFIEWESGTDAYRTSAAVRAKHGARNLEPSHAVFRSALGFDLREEPFFSRLRKELARYFPTLDVAVLQLCLKGLEEVAA